MTLRLKTDGSPKESLIDATIPFDLPIAAFFARFTDKAPIFTYVHRFSTVCVQPSQIQRLVHRLAQVDRDASQSKIVFVIQDQIQAACLGALECLLN